MRITISSIQEDVSDGKISKSSLYHLQAFLETCRPRKD
jgi:hypothetical protein